MPVLVVARIASAPLGRRRKNRHPKMQIVAEGGVTLEVPYAPNSTVTDGIAPNFAIVERAGTTPLLVRAGDNLATHSFDLTFGYSDPQKSIASELATLRKLAKQGKRMRVKLDDTTASNKWRLTAFSQQILARQFGTNEPTRAVCTLTFTEVSDPVIAVTKKGGNNGKGGGGKDDDKDVPKFYTVKKGDTLQSIAKDFYGSVSAWKVIADLNKIRDPKKIKAGQRLRMPQPKDV